MSDPIKINARYDSKSITGTLKKTREYKTNKINGVGETVQSGLRKIGRKARARAPMGPTGNLKKRIKVRFFKDDCKGYVQSRGPHSHLIEFGVSAYYVKPQAGKVLYIVDYHLGLSRFISISKDGIRIPQRKAQPFLFNSASEVIPEIEKRLEEVLDKV